MKIFGLMFFFFLALAPFSGAAAGQTTFGPWHLLSPLERSTAKESPEKLLESVGASLENMVAGAEGPSLGPDFELAVKGKSGAAPRWKALDDLEDNQAAIDFTLGLKEAQKTQARALLYRSVHSAEECPRELVLYCGSDDELRVWWNGELVHDVQLPRRIVPLGDELYLQLESGTNHLLCEISQNAGGWSFQLLHERGRVARERSELQTKINDAIDSGVDWVLRSQRLDGSWGYKIQEYIGGQTALSLYTLLKSGLEPEHPSVQRGLAFLSVSPSDSVYDTSCRMMLSGALGDAQAREQLEAHKEQLLDWQSGGFAYPEVPTNEADLSNTQYAALGLTAAQHAGGAVPVKNWKSLAKYVLECRNDDGGFCYRPGKASTGAMTAAGVATSALCIRGLGEDDRRVKRMVDEPRAGIEGGLTWLGLRLRMDVNPEPAAKDYGNTRWRNYYLYGLERVGAVTGAKLLGGHDWYWTGAHTLVAQQKDVGNWASAYGEALPNSCFALLFLQKATKTLTGQGGRVAKSSLGDDDADREASLRGSRKDGQLTVWISSFGQETLEDFEREGERGRGLRVRQVEYVDLFDETERVLATTEGDATHPAGTERWPAQLRLDEPGTHALFARITLDDGTVLTTQEIRVQADAVLEPWMLAYQSVEKLADRQVPLFRSRLGPRNASDSVDSRRLRGAKRERKRGA